MKLNLSLAALLVFAASACCLADLTGNYYGGHSVTDGIITTDGLTLSFTRTDANIDYWNGSSGYRWQPVAGYGDNYTVEWTGYVHITAPGDYGFGTMSDDGSQVWIDNSLIVDNPEFQWYDWEDNMGEGDTPGQTPNPVSLGAGYHAITVRFFEGGSYDGIELWWLLPGSGPSDIPYYGTTFHGTPPTANPNTNWQIVPASSLFVSVPTLLGDANNDGVVSADDFAAVQTHFGNTGPSDGLLLGDANDDGVVSADDFAAIQTHFGDTLAASTDTAPIPEPATLLLALAAFAVRRHKA